MATEAVPTVERVYEAVQHLVASEQNDGIGVTASQVAAHTGLTVPTVLAAFDLLAERLIVRVAQPGYPQTVMAIPAGDGRHEEP